MEIENKTRRSLEVPWTVKVYDGVEVHLAPTGHTPEMILAEGYRFPKGFSFEPVFLEDGLKVGDTVFIPAFVGGYNVLLIEQGNEGLVAKNRDGDYISFLRFGGDDRECWISRGGGNIGAISKLELNNGEE